MNTATMFSSKSDDWATPQYYFDKLNREFNFNIDVCADESNHKCKDYYSLSDNGLLQNWGGKRAFCNPPYGRGISDWVKKAYEESLKPDTLIVLLLPARTDTKWFHDYIYKKHEVRFIKGRLKFGDGKNSAPFPSMLVIMRNF